MARSTSAVTAFSLSALQLIVQLAALAFSQSSCSCALASLRLASAMARPARLSRSSPSSLTARSQARLAPFQLAAPDWATPSTFQPLASFGATWVTCSAARAAAL
jgi:hypothetical protein